MTAAVIGLAVCVAVLGVLVVGLLRAHAEVLRALRDRGIDLDPAAPRVADLELPVARPGLPPVDGPGDFVTAVDVRGTTPDDGELVLAVSAPGTHLLLAFLSSGCHTCQGFWSAEPGIDGVETVVVTKGPELEVPGELLRLDRAGLPVVMSTQAWRDYEVPVSPYFVHVLDGHVVGTGAATSWPQVAGLVRASLDGRPRSTGHEGGRVEPRSAQDRSDHVDAELAAAGILPGDPRLWPGGQP